MAENAQISDVDLIRVLGEYTAKASSAHQSYVLVLLGFSLGTLCTVGLGSAFFTAMFWLGKISGTAITVILSTVLAVGVTAVVVCIAKQRTAVELATWQLRRVYQLVSRREDLGVDVDSGTRLEMELRLSEAAFLLTSLERFDRPEKFRHFQRVGRNSPFRAIETENSSPALATNAASSGSEAAGSTTSPEYSASLS